jgi:hypothetical protein
MGRRNWISVNEYSEFANSSRKYDGPGQITWDWDMNDGPVAIKIGEERGKRKVPDPVGIPTGDPPRGSPWGISPGDPREGSPGGIPPVDPPRVSPHRITPADHPQGITQGDRGSKVSKPTFQ